MKTSLEKSLMEALSHHIGEYLGLSYPPSKWPDLERAFGRAAEDLGFQDQQQCIRWFMANSASKDLISFIALYLTTGETYFFRERRSFDIVSENILPEIVRTRAGGEKSLRFWSAGCSTGEEPYSLAIMLHRMRILLRGWHITILGTDINPRALMKAREGIYSEWSFRNAPSWLKKRYFTKNGAGRYALIPAIKNMVSFAYLNLAEDPQPALLTGTNGMDVIFCRNVLMYFSPERGRQVVGYFHRSLVEGGWLVAGTCETSKVLFTEFKPVHFSGLTLYQRTVDSADKGKRDAGSAFGSTPCSRSPIQMPSTPSPSLDVTRRNSAAPAEPAPFVFEEALAFFEQGACQEASDRVIAHLSRHGTDARALGLLCRIRANEGRLEEAFSLAEQALAVDKTDPSFHYLRAMIVLEQGKIDEAVTSLKKALFLDHNLVLAHFTLGNITWRQGKPQESRKYFERALAILTRYQPDDCLPEAEGMPAGKLRALIRATTTCME